MSDILEKKAFTNHQERILIEFHAELTLLKYGRVWKFAISIYTACNVVKLNPLLWIKLSNVYEIML